MLIGWRNDAASGVCGGLCVQMNRLRNGDTADEVDWSAEKAHMAVSELAEEGVCVVLTVSGVWDKREGGEYGESA